MSVNKVIAIGRLGQKPDLKYLPSGSAVAEFSIACTEKFKDKGGQKQEKTEWIRCKVFGKQAESVAQYLDKGRECYVEGRLETRSWDKDGVKQYRTEVVASQVVFLGGGKSRGDSGGEVLEGEVVDSVRSRFPGTTTQTAFDNDDSDPPF